MGSARKRLFTVFLLAGLAALAVAAGCGPGGDRPWHRREARPGWNVLLVSLDTARPDPLRACGGSRVPTPGLDRIRGGGFVFTEMVTPAPITLPAHASLFTGRNPWRHGARENTEYALPDGVPTLAGCFRQAGYSTAAFVASFVLNARFGLAQGFDRYEDRLSGPEPNLGPGTVELPGNVVAARASRWIRDYAARRKEGAEKRPFFLFVHLNDAHAPYRPPEPFDAQYRERPYDGELAYDDLCVGRLLDALEESGQAARTLVWVVSDHGESLGEHGEAGHGILLYDATLRVVSLLRTPPKDGRYEAGPARLVIGKQAGLIDVAPTLCALTRVPDRLAASGAIDGRSLVPELERSKRPERPLYCETMSPFVSYHWAPLFAVRTSTWKFVRAPEPELYDLSRDPGEMENVVAADTAKAVALARDLDALQEPRGHAASPGRVPSQEERELLRSLGYVGADGAASGAAPGAAAGAAAESSPGARSGGRDAAGTLPDPKRMIGFFTGQYQDAKNLLYAGRYEESADAFRRALVLDPLNNSIHLYLAGALRQAGRLAEAGNSYQAALRIEPHSPRAYFGWGEALLRQGRADSAAWAFGRSLELLPGSPDALMQLAEAERMRGDTAAEAHALESALAHGADGLEARERLVGAYRKLGALQQAQGHLDALARALGGDHAEAERRVAAWSSGAASRAGRPAPRGIEALSPEEPRTAPGRGSLPEAP